jgi:polyisoprenoid-binding protein YceI
MEVAMQRWFTKATVVLLLSLTSTIGPLAASPSDYLISRELSAVSFTVYKWTVLKEEGRFKDIRGRVHYDPAQPRDSTVDITISTASLDTNNAGRDFVLRSDDFFDVQRFPMLRFVSRRVQERPDKKLAVSGDLTIHGVTKPVDVVVKVNGVNEVPHVGRLAGFETTFHIDRTTFGVNGSKWSGGKLLISPDVEIHMAIAATDHALYTQTEAKR